MVRVVTTEIQRPKIVLIIFCLAKSVILSVNGRLAIRLIVETGSTITILKRFVTMANKK